MVIVTEAETGGQEPFDNDQVNILFPSARLAAVVLKAVLSAKVAAVLAVQTPVAPSIAGSVPTKDAVPSQEILLPVPELAETVVISLLVIVTVASVVQTTVFPLLKVHLKILSPSFIPEMVVLLLVSSAKVPKASTLLHSPDSPSA